MKKLTAVFLIISLFTLTFSGCSEIEIVELNERLIIEAIGIDYSDGIYRVTIEGLDSFSAGSESNSISAPKLTKCYLFQGETIGMAMNSISVVTGQIPLFSQARILLVGSETAKEKLSEVLDFFRREYTTRTDILFAVAEKTAEETVSANFGNNVSAGNVLEAALSSWKHTGRSCYMPLYKFLGNISGQTDNAFCPLIGIKDNGFNDTKEVNLSGTVIFGKDGKVAVISPEKTLSLMIINNQIENGDLTVLTDQGTATLEIIDCKTTKKLNIENGKAVFNIKTELSCDIPEFQSESFRGLSKNDTEKLSGKAAEAIGILIAENLSEIFYGKNYDIFHFGRALALKNNQFLVNNLNMHKNLPDFTQFNLTVKVSIRRIGKIILEEENNK